MDTTNMPNLERWLVELETTDAPQITSTLCGWADTDRLGYCCLGIGEKLRDPSGESVVPGRLDIPSGVFLTWLGFDDIGFAEHGDPEIDWPLDEYPWAIVVATVDGSVWEVDGDRGQVTAAALNDDAHLTFKQIAQVIRYFGLKHPLDA